MTGENKVAAILFTEARAQGIREGMEKGRIEGLDEAARVADDRRKLYVGSTHQADRVAGSMCSLIAADIRARITQEATA